MWASKSATINWTHKFVMWFCSLLFKTVKPDFLQQGLLCCVRFSFWRLTNLPYVVHQMCSLHFWGDSMSSIHCLKYKKRQYFGEDWAKIMSFPFRLQSLNSKGWSVLIDQHSSISHGQTLSVSLSTLRELLGEMEGRIVIQMVPVLRLPSHSS